MHYRHPVITNKFITYGEDVNALAISPESPALPHMSIMRVEQEAAYHKKRFLSISIIYNKAKPNVLDVNIALS